ncbi:unnamed protein product [Ceutorhynchus assimilis]|uniref:Suppressor of cytokine signaling 6 n=1 Tax=Ceutorhynchus assimilis TaxID=467358 RepID=A0A9N9QLC1_9CUCU|nr:unnamed protein product [Ceutorhynchus assimilis]
MDGHSRTKSWLRYLKMFKNNNNSKADQTQSEVTTFRRSLTTNSLSEPTRETNNLRKSFRKWHKRMKNCFSNNNNLPRRQSTIHIEPDTSQQSPDILLSQKENIYSSDPTEPLESDTEIHNPKNEVSSLAHNVWYWGPVSKTLVESKLSGAPDGSFLVRDSASDRHIFSISFRSVGQTLHARIERTNSGYKVFDHKGLDTVQEMIEEAIKVSLEDGIYCYTKSRGDVPNFPVRLLHPISRYDEVRSLQNLARFVIRQHINLNDIDKLCLPSRLIWFLKEEHYF